VTGLLYSLRERKGEAAVPRLKELLHDPDAQVRGRAAMTLGETRDPGLVRTLLDVLGDDVLPNELEWQVISALGMLLRREDETVRAALRTRVPRLAASLRAGHSAASSAAWLLLAAGTPEARRVLEDVAKNHPRPDVRQEAAFYLERWDAGN
jgi:HEAT repeat protein